MSDAFPRKMGHYTLLRRLAQGGMAELFLARLEGPEGARKDVVIKRILPALAQDEAFVARFLNEARIASLLNHASVVRTYDLGRADGTLFLAQEYVDGIDLRQLGRVLDFAGRRMPPVIAAAIGAQVAEALDYAHRLTAPGGGPLGVVHRDVSPDNVLISRDGYVKLVDFGVAKAFAAAPKVTRGILGKIHYMSPEQALEKPLDGRSDLFSLGVLLYTLTTGADAFDGENDYAVLTQVINTMPKPPSERVLGYPPELERIILKAMAKKPEERQANGAELAAELTRFARDAGAHLTARELAEFVDQTLAAPRDETKSSKARFATPAMPSVADLSAVSDVLEPLPIDTLQSLPPVPDTGSAPAFVPDTGKVPGFVPSDTARDLPPAPGATVPARGLVAGPVTTALPASLKNRPMPQLEKTGETAGTGLRPGFRLAWLGVGVVLLAAAISLFLLFGDTSEPAPSPAPVPQGPLRKSGPDVEADTRARELPKPHPSEGELAPPEAETETDNAPAPAPTRRR